jgi:hypothetical protein
MPVCESSSGIAACSCGGEKSTLGSSGIFSVERVAATPVFSSRNQSAVCWKICASTSSTRGAGMRRPRSIMLRYDTDGAASRSICMQRIDSSSSVSPLRLRSARSFAPRKGARRGRLAPVVVTSRMP